MADYTEIELKLNGLSYGGKAVGRMDGKVYFVEGGAPQELVRARVLRERKRFTEAEVAEVLEASPSRVEPNCPHFGLEGCGGCFWQYMNYAEQVEQKRAIIKDQLERIGGFTTLPKIKFVASPNEFGWRDKLRMHFSKNGLPGMMRRNSNEVMEIDRCPVASDGVNALLANLREYLKDGPKLSGEVELGFSPFEKSAALHLILKERSPKGLADEMLEKIPNLKGVAVDTPQGRFRRGECELIFQHKISGQTFKWKQAIDSFWQANDGSNLLAKQAVWDEINKVAEKSGKPKYALEIFGGSGNFTQVLAKSCRHVTMMESNQKACVHARRNLLEQNAESYEILMGEALKTLKEFSSRRKRPDLIFLDPPRAGFSKGMPLITKLGPQTIIYLACDPSIQARDLKVLCESGYKLESITGFDFFPQTYHIETLAVLVKEA